jgi:hypothetical protein
VHQPEASKWVSDDDQAAVDVRAAVRTGDIGAIERMLRADPALARARLGSKESGSDAAAPGRWLARLFPERSADRWAADRRWRRSRRAHDGTRFIGAWPGFGNAVALRGEQR